MMERRKYKRLDVELPITLRYKGNLIPATSLNISCGGICLETDNPEVFGEGNAEVLIDLSATEMDVSIRGRIVRVSPGTQKEIGIQFTNLYSVGHKTIEQYIQKHKH